MKKRLLVDYGKGQFKYIIIKTSERYFNIYNILKKVASAYALTKDGKQELCLNKGFTVETLLLKAPKEIHELLGFQIVKVKDIDVRLAYDELVWNTES